MKHTIGTADDCLIRQNPIGRATIPLLAGASVFLVRWFVSSYPGLYAASTEARRANRREEAGTRQTPFFHSYGADFPQQIAPLQWNEIQR